MRTQTICCDRCGACVVDDGSVLEVKAGEIAKQLAEPRFDLCSQCSSRFLDWIRDGRQTCQDERPGPEPTVASCQVKKGAAQIGAKICSKAMFHVDAHGQCDLGPTVWNETRNQAVREEGLKRA